jgi:predicted AlkP superfamily pyrophosphatase or phosphodiesterase
LLHAAPAAQADSRPRLVVLISIDQGRADYLTRFQDLFLPARNGKGVGGFRYLMERGAWFPDTHHEHIPLATGPGHAVLLTGSAPYRHGIVGNDWYDRASKKALYCVEDSASPIVGSTSPLKGISPRNLQVTTLGDELKMATGGKAKVFGLSLKDRAAVLMAGRLADGAFWFDEHTGTWISSRWYRKDGTLPTWIQQINAERTPHAAFAKSWNLSVSESALQRLYFPNNENADDRNNIGLKFPHSLTAGQSAPNRATFLAFANSPLANDWLFDSAQKLIAAEGLGQDQIPDILALNLTPNDYIGHSFGPDSAEILDVIVQTDRQLSRFFNHLNSTIGLSNVTIVLTADHGAPSIPSNSKSAGLQAGNWSGVDAMKVVEEALDKEFGADDWVVIYEEPYLWLNQDTIQRRKVPSEGAQVAAVRALEKMEGIYAAFFKFQITGGFVPRNLVADRVYRSWHPQVSGDVMIVSKSGWMPRANRKGTTHAEPYSYDTRVPLLLAGAGIRPGTYTEKAATMDIAPTLAFLLGVSPPSGSEGGILSRAVAADGPKGR